jgi:hypothetical protein
MEKGRAVADAALFIGLAYFSHGLQSLLFLLCTACRCLLLRVRADWVTRLAATHPKPQSTV